MDWVSAWSPTTVAAWSPDGHSIITGSRDGSARIWQESVADPMQWQVVATLLGHTSTIWTLDWSTDSSRVLTGSHDGSVRIWRLHGDAPAPDGNVAQTRDNAACEFVRYQGYTCAGRSGPSHDMIEAYEGTLEDCRRQCCALGEACAGFELVGGSAAAAEAEDVDPAAVGRCFFRATAVEEPQPWRWVETPPRDCYKHVRKSARKYHVRHQHDYPHAHHHLS